MTQTLSTLLSNNSAQATANTNFVLDVLKSGSDGKVFKITLTALKKMRVTFSGSSYADLLIFNSSGAAIGASTPGYETAVEAVGPAGDYFIQVKPTANYPDVGSSSLSIYVYEDGMAVPSYTTLTQVTQPIVIAMEITVEQMINDAFVSAKTYIDSKDAGLKSYTDSALTQLMNTTDLTAKLELLKQINMILDGDAATAGFQAWQSALTRLNVVETSLTDYKAAQVVAANAIATSLADYKAAQVVANNAIATSLADYKAAQVVAIKNSAVISDTFVRVNFASMKAKAAILFAI